MTETANYEAKLNIRIPIQIKQTIEEAAAELGQSVNDYLASALAETARRIIHERDVTNLSNRDRDLFLALLDDTTAAPNKALTKAAKSYRKLVG